MLRRTLLQKQQRMMRSVKVTSAGGPEKLTITEVPRPKLETGEVLVKVAATSVNRGDIAQRKGIYPPPPGVTDTLGLEFSGTVVDVEDSLEDAPVDVPTLGSRVMGIVSGGSYADYVSVPVSHCMPVPKNMSLVEAAAVPETYLTAYQCIHHHAGLLPNKAAAALYNEGFKSRPPQEMLGRKYRMLVHAGASGVGIACCQIASLFDIVSITTSSEEKVAKCHQWATYALSRTPNDNGVVFRDKVEQAVGKNGIDLVVDPVFGGSYLEEEAKLLSMDGMIVVISFLGGAKVDHFNGADLFKKRGCLRFSALRSTSEFYRTGLINSFRRRILPAFANGQLKPVIANRVTLPDVAEAHRCVEANQLAGKCVIVVNEALVEKDEQELGRTQPPKS